MKPICGRFFFPIGAIYPVESFPSWLKAFAHVNTEAYEVNALNRLLFKGADLEMVSLDIVFLALFTSVMLGLSIITFRRTVCERESWIWQSIFFNFNKRKSK
ncbi:MAG: hypothetical protein ACMUIP_14695 [bacterium]